MRGTVLRARVVFLCEPQVQQKHELAHILTRTRAMREFRAARVRTVHIEPSHIRVRISVRTYLVHVSCVARARDAPRVREAISTARGNPARI